MGVIIVTGVSGFIGSVVADLLSKNGIKVIGISRGKQLNKENKKIRYCSMDLSDTLDFERLTAIGNVTAIIHCAGESKSIKETNTLTTIRKNLRIMNNLLEYSVRNNIEKFIFLSSSKAAYSTLTGEDAYALSKKICEDLLIYCNNQYCKNYTSLRLCNIYGEDKNYSRIIPFITRNLLAGIKGGTNSPSDTKIDMCSVTKVAKIILRSLFSVTDDIVNVSPEFTVTISSLEESINNILSRMHARDADRSLSGIEEKLTPTIRYYYENQQVEK